MKKNLLYLSTSTALLLPNMANAEITCSEADCSALGYSTTIDSSCQTAIKCPFDTNYQFCVCKNPCEGYTIPSAAASSMTSTYVLESCVDCKGVNMNKIVGYKDICGYNGAEKAIPSGQKCEELVLTDQYNGSTTTCYDHCEDQCDYTGYELAACPTNSICTSYYCDGVTRYHFEYCEQGYYYDQDASECVSEGTGSGTGSGTENCTFSQACYNSCMEENNATSSDCYSNCCL
ncbi:MAG: hypothetical protein E7019_06055 [Alphaproteobacteria bacterium]|nr:hypothetical protein [Alphaproteobacteria bacterium]